MRDPVALDAADPLAKYRSRFVGVADAAVDDASTSGGSHAAGSHGARSHAAGSHAARSHAAGLYPVVSYLDGNSLGRPLVSTVAILSSFVTDSWGDRLIRGWDEEWMLLPTVIGDELAHAALGAAPGQTLIGDSTSVLLYKLIRAAVAARPGRTEIVVDTDNFPTDRYIVEGIAAERGLTVRWVETDRRSGLTPDLLIEVLSPNTAVVVVSHVAYRSGFLADLATLTRLTHEAGALIVADLCHSVGSVELELDAWAVDIAVGCSYKYLNGGPGSPAFVYVRSELQGDLVQPIQGWFGHAEPFAMGAGYRAATGMNRFQSGTPPVVGMLAMRGMIELIESVSIRAVREKSVALTEYAIEVADEVLSPLGVEVTSPRDAHSRGSHVTLDHPDFKRVVADLWKVGVIPDFRAPFGLRVGLSPLSTSFAEVAAGLLAVRDALRS